MDQHIPEILRTVIGQLTKLPGLGPKSAMRIAMTFLKWPENETRSLGKSIYELRDKLGLCSSCGALSDSNLCFVCADSERLDNLLCIVSEWDSMVTLEEVGFFQGRYMILGGLLAPLDNMGLDKLEIDRLIDRLNKGEVKEVILALGSTIEAETTATMIYSLISKRFPYIRVTRLAQGIPLGAEVKFMDRETLRQSLQYRQELS